MSFPEFKNTSGIILPPMKINSTPLQPLLAFGFLFKNEPPLMLSRHPPTDFAFPQPLHRKVVTRHNVHVTTTCASTQQLVSNTVRPKAPAREGDPRNASLRA